MGSDIRPTQLPPSPRYPSPSSNYLDLSTLGTSNHTGDGMGLEIRKGNVRSFIFLILLP